MSVFDKFSGIGVASGFKLQAKAPLDPRQVVDTIDDRNALITENGAYEGMQVYVKADKKTYVLKDLTAGTWEELGAGGGSGDLTYKLFDTLTLDTNENIFYKPTKQIEANTLYALKLWSKDNSFQIIIPVNILSLDFTGIVASESFHINLSSFDGIVSAQVLYTNTLYEHGCFSFSMTTTINGEVTNVTTTFKALMSETAELYELVGSGGSGTEIVAVEITSPASATSGTLTADQLSTLQASDNNYIIFNDEIYRLADKEHTTGVLSYTHNGWNGTAMQDKSINITISTLAWTLVTASGGGSSSGFKVTTFTLTADDIVSTTTDDTTTYTLTEEAKTRGNNWFDTNDLTKTVTASIQIQDGTNVRVVVYANIMQTEGLRVLGPGDSEDYLIDFLTGNVGKYFVMSYITDGATTSCKVLLEE